LNIEKEKFPLYNLERKQLNGYLLHLKEITNGRFVEERNFNVYVKDQNGHISKNPVIVGKYFAGRGKWLKPWIDIVYYPALKFLLSKGHEESVYIPKEGLDFELFAMIAELIPLGGRLMVEYSGIEHRETAEGLRLGIPAAVTPLGYLMWESGFRWFKDWYFPEGGMEGGQKLQANKPTDDKHNRERVEATVKELTEFLNEKKDLIKRDIGKAAKQRALKILNNLGVKT
jgi:hypothetical protein